MGAGGSSLWRCPSEVVFSTAASLLACNHFTQVSWSLPAPCCQPRLPLCRQAVLSQERWSSFTTCCGQTTECPETLPSSCAWWRW